MRGLLLCLAFLTISCGCIEKRDIEAALWLNTGLPKYICDKHPELYIQRGVYRHLNNGSDEVISYCATYECKDLPADKCNPERQITRDYLSIRKDEYDALIKKAYGRKGN